jgi:hypothetical protein
VGEAEGCEAEEGAEGERTGGMKLSEVKAKLQVIETLRSTADSLVSINSLPKSQSQKKCDVCGWSLEYDRWAGARNAILIHRANCIVDSLLTQARDIELDLEAVIGDISDGGAA